MRIRPATLDDLPTLIGLANNSRTAAHWSRQQCEAALSNDANRTALVAEDGAGIHGFLVARCLDQEWELENVVVAPDSQRRGIGSRLLDEFLNIARSRSAKAVFLEVRESNHPARKLYEEAGFLESGRRRNYYRDPAEDALTYSLELT